MNAAAATKLLHVTVVIAALVGCSSAGGSGEAEPSVVATTTPATIAPLDSTIAPTVLPSARMSQATAAAVEECIVALSSYAMGDYSVEYANTDDFLEPGVEKCDHALALLDGDGLSGAAGSLSDVISQRSQDTRVFIDKIVSGSATEADGAKYDEDSAGFYDEANARANEVR
jgi:hypothetical protein